MRFVPVKSIEQQSVLSLHRVRQGFVQARTAQANQIRGLLAEFGIVVPTGIGHLERQVPELIEDAENELTGSFRLLIRRLMDHLKELDRQVRELEAQIQAWHRSDQTCRRLARSRHRATYRERSRRICRRRKEFQERPATCGMARSGAPAELQRRQERAAGHLQTR